MTSHPRDDAVDERPVASRNVPCICPRQFEARPPVGITVSTSESRSMTVERVKCSDCARTWRRVDAR